MAEETPAVTVAQTAGTTVVVNNKRDGIKKYGTALLLWLFAVIVQGLKAQFPKWGPLVDILMDGLTAAGLIGGGAALTSPFDKRGVVMDSTGVVTVDPAKVPSAPSSPTGPGGVGLSLLICCLALPLLTGCVGTSRTIPQTSGCPVRYQNPVPLLPVATASKTVPVSKVQTAGLNNPGAQPGETFSAAQGGASCQQRLTVDGWVTICDQPNDGDSFDIRNQDLYSKAPAVAPTVEREVTAAQPKVIDPLPVRPAPPDPVQAREDLKARFPGLLGS